MKEVGKNDQIKLDTHICAWGRERERKMKVVALSEDSELCFDAQLRLKTSI